MACSASYHVALLTPTRLVQYALRAQEGRDPIKPSLTTACLSVFLTLAAPPSPAAAPSAAVAAPEPEEPPIAVAGAQVAPIDVLSAPQTAPEPAAPEPLPVAARATASWFGPGLYGNRTACGQTLTTELLGVAHRTLPCGASVTLRHGQATVALTVVDRGPFVGSREFDLTYAAKLRLGCPDLCRLEWLR